MQKYYFSNIVDYSFEETIQKVTEKLQEQGFGVLTEIDVQATLKDKLDVAFPPYRILGACNPPFALKALETENKIGTMLPCNVIIQDLGNGQVEVAAINPLQSMIAVDNRDLKDIALAIGAKLQVAVSSI